MKTSVLFTLALGLVVAGCSRSTRSNTAATGSTSTYATASQSGAGNVTTDLNNAANSAANAIGNAASSVAINARMTEWKLTPSDIQSSLDNDTPIVRSKPAAAGAPTGTTDKSVIKSMVTGRLDADSDIAALKLKVSADRHGDVTLKGKADSADEVGRAVALALDTEGVVKVTSKIELSHTAKMQ